MLGQVYEALDESPAPETEWLSVTSVLGAELVAGLVGASAASIRRYLAGSRITPDRVAVRLHFLALVIADLAGAYNDVGVRRWFSRPRERLGGVSPDLLLAGDWSPDDEGPRQVRDLANGLAASPAT